MKNKKKKNQSPRNSDAPVFTYTSVCCSSPAEKPACVRVPLAERDKSGAQSTLGHWRCAQCQKPCKVTRSLRKAPDVQLKSDIYSVFSPVNSTLPQPADTPVRHFHEVEAGL